MKKIIFFLFLLLFVILSSVNVSAENDDTNLPDVPDLPGLPELPGDDGGLPDILDILLEIVGNITGLNGLGDIIGAIMKIANQWFGEQYPDAIDVTDSEKIALYIMDTLQTITKQNEILVQQAQRATAAAENTDTVLRYSLTLGIFLMVVRFLWRILYGWFFSGA